MKHIAYSTGTPVELDCDYVVVGSGAGGATAAVSLARGGASVVLVEAGPWRDAEHCPHTAWGGLRDLMYQAGAQLTMPKAAWPVLQAQAVGGTTVVNSAICVRTPGDIFAQWEREHGVGGQAFAEELWRYQDELERELHVEEVPVDAMGRYNELAVEGARKLGYEGHVMRRYTRSCAGSGGCINGCTAGRKQSMNVTFVPELRRLGGTVLSCAPAERVLLEGGRAVGVVGRFRHPLTRKKGARFTVRASKGVFVACSVTRTPLLLRASGIRSRALGEGFRSHPGAGVFGIYDEEVDFNTGATQGWASIAWREEPGFKLETLSIPPELVFARVAGAGHKLMSYVEDYRHLSMTVLAVRAESTGRVRRMPWGAPRIHYVMDRADLARARAAYVVLARSHFAAGAKQVMPCIYGLPAKLGPDEVGLIEQMPLEPRNFLFILSHLFGGAMMGRDPASSVCDPQGRVHGVKGLYVADASQIPTNLGVNPQHTIMSLARMRAHHALNA